MAKHIVATTTDIAPGQRRLVTVKGRPIAIFNVAGEFFGIHNKCPHEGGPLCQGAVSGLFHAEQPGEYHLSRPGEFVRCPWHGWEFEIRTGQSYCHPSSVKVKAYEVQVEEGAELVKGPFVAETVPVTIEGRYVVVEM